MKGAEAALPSRLPILVETVYSAANFLCVVPMVLSEFAWRIHIFCTCNDGFCFNSRVNQMIASAGLPRKMALLLSECLLTPYWHVKSCTLFLWLGHIAFCQQSNVPFMIRMGGQPLTVFFVINLQVWLSLFQSSVCLLFINHYLYNIKLFWSINICLSFVTGTSNLLPVIL